jgi:hypothetical protein
MAKIITKEYDEVLLEIAAKISQSSTLVSTLGELDAYDIREAARVLKTLRNRVKELEGKECPAS